MIEDLTKKKKKLDVNIAKMTRKLKNCEFVTYREKDLEKQELIML